MSWSAGPSRRLAPTGPGPSCAYAFHRHRQRARAEQRSVASAIESAAAAVRSAEAQAAFAETTWRRFQALRQRGSISVHEYDQAEAAHRSAAAELERARRAHDQLGAQSDAAAAAARQAETFSAYTQIRAPFDGVITGRHIDPGAQAGPGMPLLTIDRASRYRAEAPIDGLNIAAMVGATLLVCGTPAQQADVLDQIERIGGVVAGIERGWFQREIALSAERQQRIKLGESAIFLHDILRAAPLLHPTPPLLVRAMEVSIATIRCGRNTVRC